MYKKIIIMVILSIIILAAGCSSSKPERIGGIEITDISSSIGAVDGNTGDIETQSFKYTITLKNNEAADMTIISVRPVLSEELLERISNKDITLQVNQVIRPENSLGISGEIIFDAKGLTKEQIIGMEPFVDEIRIVEERTIDKSF